MRITGGEWCSRRLNGPGRGMRLRPTPDAMRERVFAVLGERVAGRRVLDLYAGTGMIGFEALSRGATAATFVERHRAAVRVIERNRTALGLDEERAQILPFDAARALRELARWGEHFGLIWADPPFDSWENGLAMLHRGLELGLFEPGAIACFECPAEADAGALGAALVLERDLKGGASRVIVARILR